MGCIVDIDVLFDDYCYVVCVFVLGGVFFSKNGGIIWKFIFDEVGFGLIGVVVIN